MLESAKGIIYSQNQFLLQLRDNTHTISYPNCWSFFGGEIEYGETPWDGLKRELLEEIGWIPEEGFFLNEWFDSKVQCKVFFYNISYTGNKNDLELNEGQSMEWFTVDEIKLLKNITPNLVNQIIISCEYINVNDS